MRRLLIVLLIVASAGLIAQQVFRADRPLVCADCDDWNAPREPFRVFGNTYFVGTNGLSAVLITSDAGHILLDGGLTQSAPLIDANIRALGFALKDVRLILNSHEHYDHAGGIAALQRASGARVAASPAGARALQLGHPLPEDPQYRGGMKTPYPPVKTVETIADGTTLRVGPLEIRAHFTPGHTPGATTWSWRSCEGRRCLDIVYADSLTATADDGFSFNSIADTFRQSIARVGELPCDVLLAPHPSFVNAHEKGKKLKENPSENPFVDPKACRVFANMARKRLDQRLKPGASQVRVREARDLLSTLIASPVR